MKKLLFILLPFLSFWYSPNYCQVIFSCPYLNTVRGAYAQTSNVYGIDTMYVDTIYATNKLQLVSIQCYAYSLTNYFFNPTLGPKVNFTQGATDSVVFIKTHMVQAQPYSFNGLYPNSLPSVEVYLNANTTGKVRYTVILGEVWGDHRVPLKYPYHYVYIRQSPTTSDEFPQVTQPTNPPVDTTKKDTISNMKTGLNVDDITSSFHPKNPMTRQELQEQYPQHYLYSDELAFIYHRGLYYKILIIQP